MLKTHLKPFLIFTIIALFIAQVPLSTAEQYYGTIQGRAIDRNGNAIAGVSLVLQDNDYRTVGNAVTGSNGYYSFSNLAMPARSYNYRIKASFNGSGHIYSSGTAWFEVLAMSPVTRDVTFDDYPPATEHKLYGVVTQKQGMIVPVPATVYLSNGMYTVFGGGNYDQWSFTLPVGRYIVWAEANANGVTYTSEKYNVEVTSAEDAYMPIYLGSDLTTAYHQQPAAVKNEVRGAVLQKNGVPYSDVRVSLYRIADSGRVPVAATTTDATGQFLFDDVGVDGVSARFLVSATYEAMGESHTQDTDPFTVYYANTLNVNHVYNVPITVSYVNSGSATIVSDPAGAHISVDGKDTGSVTPSGLSLKAGTHEIGLTLEGYFGDSSTVQVQPDATIAVNRTLKPSTGNLSLDVNPANAQVYFDGRYLGVGPMTIVKGQCGDHSYVIACDGYLNESGTVTILPGESVTRQINMVAAPGLSLTYLIYLINSMLATIGSIF